MILQFYPLSMGLMGKSLKKKKLNWRWTEAKSVQTSFLQVKRIRIPNEYQRYVLKRVISIKIKLRRCFESDLIKW
jgi:hypothetical protein